MLRVSIHAGDVARASRFNVLAWCDIGYETLQPLAQYKTVLFETHNGSSTPVLLANYPRWSASLWDLAARAIALGLHPDRHAPVEELLPVDSPSKGCAFAQKVSAIIEHVSPNGQMRNTLAAMEVSQVGRHRGMYRARIEEHTMARVITDEFAFRPAFFRPAQLVAHAAAVRLTGGPRLPARPALCVPEVIMAQGVRHVAMHTLVEPARTGFARWLLTFSEPPTPHPDAPQGVAPEVLYVKFLQEAV
ncbi:hypothetical protein [Pseudazoarcus pumilus]|uniref:Uncharacterized protein n=1 Tax=Pseudazoarcus pumilus TaxID=2067960 RepID=A0A2I6S9C5_9RHOO|nr:hypothetical protein [Pseudazoarcus pumilus]AUN95854.1 hypothetical protein C0099_13500 [Pseudazoarcus pumilus]